MDHHLIKPEHMNWLTPYLVVRDVAASLQFYQKAFGFDVFSEPITGEDGRFLHGELYYKKQSCLYVGLRGSL